jgi:hypothetical protein
MTGARARTLHDPIICGDPFNFAAGLVFVQGKGFQVGVMEAGSVGVRAMTAPEARAFANDLAATTGKQLALVLQALRDTADKLDAMGLASKEVDGHG